jgi:hypothetical protein
MNNLEDYIRSLDAYAAKHWNLFLLVGIIGIIGVMFCGWLTILELGNFKTAMVLGVVTLICLFLGTGIAPAIAHFERQERSM